MGILSDIKTMLGIRDVDAFDAELIIYINSAFSLLRQLGVGPDPQLVISDDATDWSVFEEQFKNIEMVKEYVYLSVKIIFDPNATGHVLEAFKNRLEELTWRLIVSVESDIPKEGGA